jgi:cell wall-associated NlpC family hydrolase
VRPGRRQRAATAAAVIAALATLLVRPVGATPMGDKQAEAIRIAQRLETLGERISVLDERYNQARLREQAAREALAATKVRLQASDAQLAEARARLARVALSTYLHSGSASLISVLLRGEDVGDLDRRRRYVRTALDERQQAITDVATAQRQLEASQTALESEQKAAHVAAADAATNRAAAETTIASQERTLAKVTGEMAGLVKAEQANRAAEEQRIAEARLAPSTTTTTTTVKAAAAGSASTSTTSTTTTTVKSLLSGATTTTTTTTAATAPAPLTSPPPSARASAAVEEAKRQIGKPYVFGGSGPDNFDCSGLVAWAWRAAGVSLPHSAGSQYRDYPKVPLNALQPGDIVVFGSDLHHNGIYVGGGQMIHAPQTGDVVKYASIYRQDVYGASRPSS